MKKIIPFKKNIIFKTNLEEITSISLEHSINVDDLEVKGNFIISGTYKIASTSANKENFYYDLPFLIQIDEKYDTSKVIADIDDFYYEIINSNVLAVSIDVSLDNLEEREICTSREEDEIEELLLADDLKDDNILDKEDSRNDIEKEKNNFRTISKEDDKIDIKNEVFKEEARKDIEDVIEDIIVEKQENKIEIQDTKEEKEVIEKEDNLKKASERTSNLESQTRDVSSVLSDFDMDRETYSSYRVYIVREGDSIESILNKYSITKEELEVYNDISELKIMDKLIIPYKNVES